VETQTLSDFVSISDEKPFGALSFALKWEIERRFFSVFILFQGEMEQ
jgi:hypothetical protein